ncbi:hypothetical protein PAAG_08081 [Paracoccidioides lutzii Pb01]|uniref:Uncharacterized protein n=1 Tax=Paracoccidioides lutzii (strain ATCC MYA-826 / Pb01) TaxID=502779 RepID=C1HBE0_PARBA|nr:hypothetical protein PAAG_08081 [Paracoccidioides lutzii Pb01]EEH37663.2 hypothetical protein PAAG_08081 [Paracoccidioides lutzii Pb01]
MFNVDDHGKQAKVTPSLVNCICMWVQAALGSGRDRANAVLPVPPKSMELIKQRERRLGDKSNGRAALNSRLTATPQYRRNVISSYPLSTM